MTLRGFMTFIFFAMAISLCASQSLARQTDGSSSGQATGGLFDSIHVQVGPSARELDPVAIATPGCPKGAKGCATLDTALNRDLMLSGLFKVLDRASFLADPAKETLVATNWPDWTNIGAHYVVKTSVTPNEKGLWDIEFRFLHVSETRAIKVDGQSARNVKPGAVRGAVHAFVNGIIEVMTGKRGIFGSRIVFTEKTSLDQRDIVSIEMDGHGQTTLISNKTSNMFPKWAPGGKILYTSLAAGHPQLYIGDTRLTNDDFEYRGAEFSPDGNVIAASVDMGEQSDLVLLDPKTGKITKQLTDTEWDEVTPTWSPDGRAIAFVSNKGTNPQIYVIHPDGTGERRLTMAGIYNTSPRFGSNGKVVFQGMDEFHSDLFAVDLAGNIERLTQEQGNNKDACWSPDGRYLAFLSDRAGKWKLWIMTEDGRYQFPITSKAGWYATPHWR